MHGLLKLLFTVCLLLFLPVTAGYFGGNIYPACAYAEEGLKINSINFDNSDSIIFLGTSGGIPPENVKIKKSTLIEPDRTFFDVENAVITFPNASYSFQNSKLKKAVIAQNSTAPDIVRIVLWTSSGYNAENIKVLNIKNNIIIKLNNAIPQQQYQTQVYRETKDSSADYFDKTIIYQNIEQKQEADEIFDKVQKAFKESEQELVRPNIEQKQAKLKSRFFLERFSVQNDNIILSGIGVVNTAKPFTLKEPSRVVFDLPNTILKDDLREKEFSLSDGSAMLKLGQFTPSTARIVIKTENTDDFVPVYSRNLQTLLIGKSSNLKNFITSSKSELAYFKENRVNDTESVINIAFSDPVIYSIKRRNDIINITFYNLINFDTASFNQAALKNKTGFKADRLSSNVYQISFPEDEKTLVDCYETLNASQLRLVFSYSKAAASSQTIRKESSGNTGVKNPKEVIKQGISIDNLIEKQKQKRNQNKILKSSKNKNASNTLINKIQNKVIVIDPGHGGNDTGALRNNVLEKDLTLQIALKIRDILIDKGLNHVIMTRSTDKTLSLPERTEISNNNHADIYVSIHINASVKTEIKGIETHYYNNGGYIAAQIIHKELMKNLTVTDRGLFKSKFYVINHTEAPAVLLELGFISNEQERNALSSEQRQAASAQAVADGIVEYLMEHCD